jgi:hypothetical protein
MGRAFDQTGKPPPEVLDGLQVAAHAVTAFNPAESMKETISGD